MAEECGVVIKITGVVGWRGDERLGRGGVMPPSRWEI